MAGSEIFNEVYALTHHAINAPYPFFGLEEANALVPWIWTALGLKVIATVILSLHPLRKTHAG